MYLPDGPVCRVWRNDGTCGPVARCLYIDSGHWLCRWMFSLLSVPSGFGLMGVHLKGRRCEMDQLSHRFRR